ncbi:alanine racemase [Pseudolysinimonas kribbensis]|uniref:Alanine racemase n=1 Tax=Pseudolysinimonas kribbensis TaxID=433641 RepID=A0ABQ6K5R5_9MICO|nr:alanine racemase [Pseudolysinimonas kribbensis]GMA94764.1 alanine racemase [Pseudolysinimonas kribbensis]
MTGWSHLVGAPIEDLPSPAVLVDLPTLRRNIAEMAAHTDALGVALRPHWKTSKVLEVGRMQLAAGAVGLTAATANEVLALAEAGIPDVFWAYPPVGAHRVAAALAAAERTRLIVGVDSLEAIAGLAAAAVANGTVVDVRLEIDTGLGRMGVRPDDAVALARVLHALDGVRLEGVYTHEGHVQGLGADPERRAAVGLAAGRTTAEVAEAIRADGIPLTSVSVGSTAGARSAPTASGITEARPGTYVYGDENQVAIGTISEADTAITVQSRVISVQRGEPVLVDAGTKAMSADGSMHGDGRIGTIVSSGGGLIATGHEEHGFVRGSTGLRVGDLIRVRPNHACGLSNMHSHVFAIEDGVVADVWPVVGRH